MSAGNPGITVVPHLSQLKNVLNGSQRFRYTHKKR